MKIPLVAIGLLLAGVDGACASVDPKETVRAALQDFLDQPNYTWATGNSRGIPEQNGDDTEQAVGGQHEKGGYTKVNFRAGPHIPREEWPVNKPWPGFMDREDFMSNRWVFWTPEGWKLLHEFPSPGTGPAARSPPPSRPGTVRLGSVSLPVLKVGVSMRFFGFRRPDLEMAIVLPHLGEITEMRPGVFHAELDPQGAALLLTIPRALVRTENARAAVTVTIRNGTLLRYELEFDGTWIIFGRRVPRSVVVIRDLTELGTTVIEVPAEVRRMFGDESAPDVGR